VRGTGPEFLGPPEIRIQIMFIHVENLASVMKRVLITPHQGLGDHILCNGLYREYAKSSSRVLVTVKRKYHKELSNMLSDLQNLSFIVMPNTRSWTSTRLIQIISRFLGVKVVGLGSYGSNFFPRGVRFDNNFYDQASIDFEKRWDSFYSPRNLKKERELFDFFGCENLKYVFVHEDESRNFKIDRKKLPEGYSIVQPIADPQEFNLVDYRMIIENAAEIHVIESSFAAFIESISPRIPLYAHRYARHHALNDFRHEFTYKNPWTVLIK
jgi:hypothetical protein